MEDKKDTRHVLSYREFNQCQMQFRLMMSQKRDRSCFCLKLYNKSCFFFFQSCNWAVSLNWSHKAMLVTLAVTFRLGGGVWGVRVCPINFSYWSGYGVWIKHLTESLGAFKQLGASPGLFTRVALLRGLEPANLSTAQLLVTVRRRWLCFSVRQEHFWVRQGPRGKRPSPWKRLYSILRKS